jgi:hypothetical protein
LFIAVTLFMPQGVVGLLKKREAPKRPEPSPGEPQIPAPGNVKLAQESTA